MPNKRFRITQEQAIAIQQYHKDGLSNPEISQVVGVPYETLRSHMSKRKMKSNKWQKSAPITDNHLMLCECCQTWKTHNEFRSYVGKTGVLRFYKARMCKVCCYKKDTQKINDDPLLFFSRLVSGLKRRANKLELPYDIDANYLLDIYSKQNGKCFYTDVPITCHKQEYNNKKYSLSVDKVIPDKGYIRGNVVLTTFRINTIKSDLSLDEMQQWMPGWYERIRQCTWLSLPMPYLQSFALPEGTA